MNMCDTCGCNEGETKYTLINSPDHLSGVPEKDEHAPLHSHPHAHTHPHDHSHGQHPHHHHTEYPHVHEHTHMHAHSHDQLHSHPHSHTRQPVSHIEDEDSRQIPVGTDLMQRNNMEAARNRGFFEAKNMRVLNLVSSPGSGKTSILERTLLAMDREKTCVIEGDQQTSLDALRISATGVKVIQINTGNACHLDAAMVYRAVRQLDPPTGSMLFIENVGNLVCPALFDLGEQTRVLILSVTEGEDKPLKYPNMFHASQVCLINKTDLLPYLSFSLEAFRKNALQVNPNLSFIEISATTGEGFGNWIDFLSE